MPVLRKIFFYIFLAIYLTVCPLLIARMLGYVYNPETRQIVKTGIIYVSSNPPGADVYINDIKANEATPTVIRDLKPNNYTIRLELKDYKTWHNTIPVVDRKATVLENILLIPQQWVVKPQSNRPFENLLALGDGSALLLWKEKNINNLYLLKINKPIDDNLPQADAPISLVLPAESIYKDGEIIRFFTVDKSPFFIVHTVAEGKHRYLWADVRDKQPHIEDISDLLPQQPVSIWWEPNDEKNLYAYFEDKVNRLDIKARAIYPDIAAKDIPSQKDPVPASADIKGKVFNENNEVWLTFSDRRIGLWDKKQDAVQWLFQDCNRVEQAFWANNGSAILYRDGNQIFLLDKKSFSKPKVQKITTALPNSAVYYSEKSGKLYYIEPLDHLLSSITILRHKPMLPKNIAGTLRLKEFEP